MSPAFEDGSPVSDPWKLRPMRSSQEILGAPSRPSRPSFSLIKKKNSPDVHPGPVSSSEVATGHLVHLI